MAKRRTFLVTLTDVATGVEIARSEKYAMNSGVRESEALVRALARSEGCLYQGAAPAPRERNNPNSPYARWWTSEATGRQIIARVENVA